MSKILLDAGPSKRGWSYYGAFYKCAFLFALKHRLLQQDVTEPTTKGTMGHVGIAHQFAIWMCEQNGWDSSVYYMPEDAIREWARRNPHGLPFVDQMIEVLRRYLAKYPTPPGRILGVEMPAVAVLGMKEGRWGLWITNDNELAAWSYSGRVGAIEPWLLDVPGHPNHGTPITITKRIDLVVQERDGRIWEWDHKFKAYVGKNTVHDYFMDGQFAVTRIMGAQMYGERNGGTRLNLIQTAAPFTIIQPAVPETPYRDGRFAKHLHYRAHEIARMERDLKPEDWPMTQDEQVCKGRYGPCMGMLNGKQPGPCALGVL